MSKFGATGRLPGVLFRRFTPGGSGLLRLIELLLSLRFDLLRVARLLDLGCGAGGGAGRGTRQAAA